MVESSPRCRTNAIWRPSGDHVGLASSAGSLVSRRTSDDPTSVTYTSQLSCFAPFQENATCSPSGENVGYNSDPVSEESDTGRAGAGGSGRGVHVNSSQAVVPAITSAAATSKAVSPRRWVRTTEADAATP